MSAATRWLRPLPILVAAGLFAAVSGAHGLTAAVALPSALALFVPRRMSLGVPAQVLLMIGCALALLPLVVLLPAQPTSSAIASEPLRNVHLLLGASGLAFAGLRLHIANPAGGHAGTLGAGLLAFLACGTVHSGDLFPALLVVYGGLGFASLRQIGLAAGERQASRRLDPRHAAALVAVLAVAGALSLSLAASLPRAYSAAYRMALGWALQRNVSGFHDGPLQLGGLGRMLLSDEIVLRVEGEVGEHLKGAIYTRYRDGRWLPAGEGERREVRLAALPDSSGAGEPGVAWIRFAKRDLDRFFIPPEARRLQFSPHTVRVDRMGIVRTREEEHPVALRLLPAIESDSGLGTVERVGGVAAPDAGDLVLPDDIEHELRRLVDDWADAAAPSADRLAALRIRLEADYAYSIDFDLAQEGMGPEGTTGRGAKDPILAFLHDRRSGHCEYFASAITLLARAADLPARLVTGYRVAERNRFGDYAIVRERHAHAWSEVFLAGEGWVTVDPSPLRGHAALDRSRTPLVAGLLDWAVVAWQRRGQEALLILLVVGLAAVQVHRLIAGRAADGREVDRPVSGPPRHIEALLGRLAEGGLARREGESLESLARRVAGASAWSSAGRLIGRYAALRYGGVGDGEAIRHDVEAWLREIGSA